MDTLWSTLLGIISNSLPSGVSMIGGILSLLLSGGAWGTKFDDKAKTFLRRLGFVFLTFGGFLTVIVSVLQIWDSYSLIILPIWSSVWNVVLQYINSLAFWLIVGLAGLSTISLRWVRTKQIEKGYKLQVIPVDDPENKEAHIQVENIGQGNFRCAARLVKITERRKQKGGRGKNIEVVDLYPNSPYLGWANGYAYETLYMRSPTTIDLVTGSFHSVPSGMYGQNSRSVYTGSFIFSGYGKSKSLDNVRYTVCVKFLRWNGLHYVEMIEFNETLEINSDGVKWIKD